MRSKSLSEFEAAVIDAVKLDGEVSLKEVAERLGKSVSTLRATLSKLEENGYIRFYPFVNVFRLGYSVFLFYFNPVQAQEDAVIATLKASDSVSWLARYSSESFRYCASFVCKTPLEYQRALEKLGREHGASFHSSATQVQTALSIFSPKYLAPARANESFITLESEGQVVEVDDTDRAILSGLLNNTYSSIRDLARQLELPHSTVSERVTSLKARGVIERFVYLPNAAVLGMGVYTVTLKARTLHPNLRAELFKFCKTEPTVTVFLECFGAWDFEVGFEAPSREVVDAAVTRISARFGKLLHVVSILKREERMKVLCYPFCAPGKG